MAKSATLRNELASFPIPNLVQGVSQQAPEQRRDTQCAAQFDCINSPVNGCEARPPVEVLRPLIGAQFQNAYCHQIAYGTEEHYLSVFAEGTVRVFDLVSGEECDVDFVDDAAYISTYGREKDTLRAATVEDYTFLANTERKPAMDNVNLSPTGYNEGIIFIKAGGYVVTYVASVTLGGNIYTWRYTTPDNSTAANAQYINTSQIAATFFRAFTGGAAVPTSSGTAVTAGSRTGLTNEGAGAGAAGQTSYTGSTTLLSLGFYVALNGNVILIGRNDDTEFSIDVSDGVGDTYMRCAKDQVQNFEDLPYSCFPDFTIKVKGSNRQEDDDYYVSFQENVGQGGYWQEVVKPGIPVDLDASTMPHALVNTGYQGFSWERPPWGSRVCGDGVTNSLDPSFIGVAIRDIFYSNSRFAIMTQGSNVWSKNKNSFTFFTASAQTALDTDPVDVTVGGGKEIALLRKGVLADVDTFLWADNIQFKVDVGNEAFKQSSVDAKPAMRYEYSSPADPLPLGQSLYVVSEPGLYSSITDVTILDGKARGETIVTSHVPKYIPRDVRSLTGSSTLNMMFGVSDQTPSRLYVYNYFLSDNNRLQSAWNTWRLPEGCQIVWMGIRRNLLHLLIQRGTWGALLCRIDLTTDLTDPDQSDYCTRVDLRLPEGLCSTYYNAAQDETWYLLPFPVPEARGYDRSVDDDYGSACPMFVATRTTGDDVAEEGGKGTYRGNQWTIKSITWDDTLERDVIKVDGDATGTEVYLGFRISAEREEGQFFLRSPKTGALSPERLQIHNVLYTYSESGYFRAEVTPRSATGNAKVKRTEMSGRVFGDPANITGQYPIRGGQLRVPVAQPSDNFSIKLVNDSFLPSRWTRAAVEYTAQFVAKPSSYGSSGTTNAG